MVNSFNIKGLNISFVFRHKWDEKSKEWFGLEYKGYNLGLFYNRNKIVGSRNFHTPKKWNHVSSHMIGIHLIVCKAWVTIDYGGKHIKTTDI